jgi:hypothetical protein
MKPRLNCYFDPLLLQRLDDLAARKGLSKSAIVEAAVASLLSPDALDQREAAIARRLDKLTRSFERLERDVSIGNEAVALFVRFWLTTTPSLPEETRQSAHAAGKKRYEGFVEALGQRVSKGRNFARELSEDVGHSENERSNSKRP